MSFHPLLHSPSVQQPWLHQAEFRSLGLSLGCSWERQGARWSLNHHMLPPRGALAGCWTVGRVTGPCSRHSCMGSGLPCSGLPATPGARLHGLLVLIDQCIFLRKWRDKQNAIFSRTVDKLHFLRPAVAVEFC